MFKKLHMQINVLQQLGHPEEFAIVGWWHVQVIFNQSSINKSITKRVEFY